MGIIFSRRLRWGTAKDLVAHNGAWGQLILRPFPRRGIMTPHSGPQGDVPWWKKYLPRRSGPPDHSLAAPLPAAPEQFAWDHRPQVTIGHRAYPPVALADTCLAATNAGERRALHDATGALFISNEEVLRIHRTHRHWEFRGKQNQPPPPPLEVGGRQEGLYMLRFRSGIVPVYRSVDLAAPDLPIRHLIPQQAHRSCTYAAASMVLLDACSRYGVKCPSTSSLLAGVIDGNLGSAEHSLVLMRHAIGNLPLTPQIVTVPFHRTDTLSDLLDRSGPAAAAIGGELGMHSIVLDSVTERENANPVVRIRDPFHGWDIETRLSSLTKRGLQRAFLVCSK